METGNWKRAERLERPFLLISAPPKVARARGERGGDAVYHVAMLKSTLRNPFGSTSAASGKKKKEEEKEGTFCDSAQFLHRHEIYTIAQGLILHEGRRLDCVQGRSWGAE